MNLVFREFQALLDRNPPEEEVQKFIAANTFLISELGFGVKRIFAKPTFGGDLRTDFALAGWANYICWTFVEIEKPGDRLFTREGLIAAPLNRALKQVNSWWIWLYDYSDYASNEFRGLSGEYNAAIIIGRRRGLSKNDIRRLEQHNAAQLGGKLKIVTYDVLLDTIESCTEDDIAHLRGRRDRLTRFRAIKEWRTFTDSGGGL